MFFLKKIEDFFKHKERQSILKNIIKAKYDIYLMLKDLREIESIAKQISNETNQKEIKEKVLLIIEEVERIQDKGKHL